MSTRDDARQPSVPIEFLSVPVIEEVKIWFDGKGRPRFTTTISAVAVAEFNVSNKEDKEGEK